MVWIVIRVLFVVICCFFFQAEDGIRDLVRSRGLGDVYKRQVEPVTTEENEVSSTTAVEEKQTGELIDIPIPKMGCLLYTSDAADDLLCVDLGGRRIIKKKHKIDI